MSDEIRVWGIHTMNDNLFLKENVIAIGWREMGDLSVIGSTREAFKKKYTEVYADAKKGSISNGASMLYKFVYDIKVGDYVVFPSRSNREINIGQIIGEYTYDPNEHEYVQKRDVKWLKHLSRTYFTQGSLYEIGASLTFFSVKNYADEFLSALDKNFKKKSQELTEDDSVGATAEDIKQSTKDFILKELSRKLKGYDFEEFVADLLNAMGYKTTLSKHGGDHGVDITAYKDELPPRIVVQVKSIDADIKEATVLQLAGLMKPGDYGLFITLSKYTKNAQNFLYENPNIRGINGDELVELIFKYYDKLSDKYKKIIPLKMVYIPVAEESYDA